LVDQFPISRLAFAEWLKQVPDLRLCGEADCAATALKAIAHLKPDIVVTEVLRQQDLEFIHNLHQQHPRLPILVFSFRDESWYAPLALKAGADGYLMKGVTLDGLMNGIRSTLEGRIVLSPEMRALLLMNCSGRKHTSASARYGRRCIGLSGHRRRLRGLL